MLTLRLICLSAAWLLTNITSSESAEPLPPVDEIDNFQVETLLDGLDNPAGLAFHPLQDNQDSAELFVAESRAGRVIRVRVDGDTSVEPKPPVKEVIKDFQTGNFGSSDEESFEVGPLAIGFVSQSKVFVTSKSADVGKDRITGFSLPEDGTIVSAADPNYSVGPLPAGIAAGIGDLQLVGIALSDKTCFLTTCGSPSQGWLLKAEIEANRLAYLQPYVSMKKIGSIGAPTGIATIPKPRPGFLVVGLVGERGEQRDAQLSYFVPKTGVEVLKLTTGLYDIMAVAFSPSGQLYVTDFAWHNEAAGGVYRIDDARVDGRQSCQAVKIASVVRPFGITFDKAGTMYVTTFGEGVNEKQGKLLRITGKL